MQNPATDRAITEYLKKDFLPIPTSRLPTISVMKGRRTIKYLGPQPSPHQEFGSLNESVPTSSQFTTIMKTKRYRSLFMFWSTILLAAHGSRIATGKYRNKLPPGLTSKPTSPVHPWCAAREP